MTAMEVHRLLSDKRLPTHFVCKDRGVAAGIVYRNKLLGSQRTHRLRSAREQCPITGISRCKGGIKQFQRAGSFWCAASLSKLPATRNRRPAERGTMANLERGSKREGRLHLGKLSAKEEN